MIRKPDGYFVRRVVWDRGGDYRQGEINAPTLYGAETQLASTEAETLLAKGDLKGATDALESTLREDSNNPELNCVYAKIMLKSNSKEKALEGVTRLRPVLALVTRNADLYRACAELARVAGDNELADLSQQNVDQLDVLEQEFHARLAAIIKSRDDVDGRLALVDLAMNTGRFEFIRKIYDGLIGYHPERTAEFHSKMMEMDRFVPPLVSLGIEQPPAAPQPDPVAGQPPVVEPAPVPATPESVDGKPGVPR